MHVALLMFQNSELLDKRIGMDVAAHVGDTQEIPLALPLSESKNAFVHRDALKYLKAVGYRRAD